MSCPEEKDVYESEKNMSECLVQRWTTKPSIFTFEKYSEGFLESIVRTIC